MNSLARFSRASYQSQQLNQSQYYKFLSLSSTQIGKVAQRKMATLTYFCYFQMKKFDESNSYLSQLDSDVAVSLIAPLEIVFSKRSLLLIYLHHFSFPTLVSVVPKVN